MRRSSVRLIVLIVAFGLVSGLAIADPDPAPPSSSAAVSGGIFTEANDKFLSTTEFTDLESNVVFLQFDMPSAVLPGQGFEIGGSANLFGLYVGAYLNSVLQGTNGLLGGGDSRTTTIDKDFLVDGAGLIIGWTEARSVSVEYSSVSTNDVRALVGLGSMGIGFRLLQNANNLRGSYTPIGAMPASPPPWTPYPWWNAIGVGGTPATAVTGVTYDDVGGTVAVSSDEYGLGKINDQELDATISFGTPLSMSDTTDLEVGGEVLLGLRNDDQSAAREQFTRVVGSTAAIDYLPGQKLDGSDPDGTEDTISDLTSYTYNESMVADSHIMIAPSVFARVMMPLKEAVTATGGVNLGLSLPIYNAKYTDNTGEEAKASLANSFYTVNVVPTINPPPADPTLIETTTTTTRGWESQDLSMMMVDLDLLAEVEVVPNDRFRFGVAYMPMITYSSSTTTYAGEAVQTTVTDNGDGADGPGDQVDVITASRSGYTEKTQGVTVTNRLNTAAQFFLIPERLRVNLGAQVDNVMIDQSVMEVITNGVAEQTTSQAVDTTDVAATTFVVTDYVFDTDVRAVIDDTQSFSQAGSSSLMYDAGLTFFFDESMFLDLRMNAAGGIIWDTTEWSLEMTILY